MTSDLIIAALLLLGGGAASAATKKRDEEVTADVDGLRLVSRANQATARAWAARFVQADAPQQLADGLARWAGIESSGNPLAASKLGERGLLQVGEQSALREKPVMLTWSEWDALSRKETPSEQHAKIAMRVANWMWARAKLHIKTDVPNDFVSALWYGKLYHQRPVDVRDGKMHGPALPMARELAVRWAGDAAKMHRLRAANVVAFGVPTP
jgi:hypothetical protein